MNGRDLRLSPQRCDKRRIGPFAAACLLGGLVVALLAISANTAVSGTSFAQSRSNPGNIFTAGSFKVLNSLDGGYVISAAGIRPGQSVTGSLTLTCQGNLKGAVSLTTGGITNTPSSPALSAVLVLKIEDITGSAQTLWNGTMNSFSSLALAQFNAGETRTYRFTVTFPESGATPELQGATSAMLIKFTGVAQ